VVTKDVKVPGANLVFPIPKKVTKIILKDNHRHPALDDVLSLLNEY